MSCPYQNICGGCPLRTMPTEEYRQYKLERFKRIAAGIAQDEIRFGTPIFVADGCRRRAEMTFQYKKGHITLGFNVAQSHEIINIEKCAALTAKINLILPAVRDFLTRFCAIKTTEKVKAKFITRQITEGEIWLTEAANGTDILLETDATISLEHRMEICDFANNTPEIVRVSVGAKNKIPETIIEKAKPQIDICGKNVFIPAGTFLQASQQGQNALTALVLQYIGDLSGNIADLFCGVGTFSYPLSANIKNKITAIDSSAELLNGFRQTVNFLTIPNIKIVQKNLFKYPLDPTELKEFAAVVFDPPRAGASAQVAQIAQTNEADKPQKIVAVSCNPHTFVNDANMLVHNGYYLKEMTMVDQFVYAEHFELVACFEKI